jgi:hypothetical protein
VLNERRQWSDPCDDGRADKSKSAEITGGKVMKKLLTVTALSVAAMLVVLPLAYGQDKAAPPAGQQDKNAPPAQAADKVFQGQLTKVDSTAKWIMVKGTGDQEMQFEYTDATQIVGSEKSVQGLAGKTGTELKVTYRDAGGKHTATRIETVEKR